jgi:hypothetical protein
VGIFEQYERSMASELQILHNFGDVSSPRAISKFADKVLRYKVGRMKVDSAKGYNPATRELH